MDEVGYLFSVRTAAILAVALAVGLAGALLTYAQAPSWPAALLAGAGCFAGALVGLHKIVARR